MPTYEYSCEDCHKHFEKTMSISEYGKEPVRCPACNSANVKREVSTFQALTSKKS